MDPQDSLRGIVGLRAIFGRGFLVGTLALAQFGPSAAATAAAAVDSAPSITVEAQRTRERLSHDVDTFFSAALVHPLPDESLIRWNHAMCPLVAGLSRAEGEFILRRVSDIARSVHAPLGKEDCNPNFLVIVARNPSGFLELLWKRKPLMFDTHYGIAPVKRFIETSRPIRVWYDFYVQPSDQSVVFPSEFSSLLKESEEHGKTGVLYPIYTHPESKGAHLSFPAVRDFAATIIVVDLNQVSTLNVGQLADYIGLLGLAQINLDTDLGPAPSILNLFHATATSHPSELTPWDRALLFALYSAPQGDRMQHSKMRSLAVNYIASAHQ